MDGQGWSSGGKSGRLASIQRRRIPPNTSFCFLDVCARKNKSKKRSFPMHSCSTRCLENCLACCCPCLLLLGLLSSVSFMSIASPLFFVCCLLDPDFLSPEIPVERCQDRCQSRHPPHKAGQKQAVMVGNQEVPRPWSMVCCLYLFYGLFACCLIRWFADRLARTKSTWLKMGGRCLEEGG